MRAVEGILIGSVEKGPVEKNSGPGCLLFHSILDPWTEIEGWREDVLRSFCHNPGNHNMRDTSVLKASHILYISSF